MKTTLTSGDACDRGTHFASGTSWAAAAAVVIGRDHALLGRNGQDHGVARATAAGSVVAVSDGCGEAAGSEVGARVSASVAVRVGDSALRAGAPLSELAGRIGGEVKRVLRLLAAEVGAGDAPAFTREHLAATLLVVVARGDEAVAFGWGDGLVRVDDRVLAIDEGGRPRYLAGDLLTDAPLPCSFEVRVEGARCVAVATDGFDEATLAALPIGPPNALLRWMRLRGRAGAFVDDGAVGLLAATSADARLW